MKRKRTPLLYTTKQIDLKPGDQLRLTHGRRTIFVYVNGRGLNISQGRYSPKPKRTT